MKRESNGQYAFDGRLDRLCVCGHDLGSHSAGSPADCLFYSLPECERKGKPGDAKPECGCLKFRESKRKRPKTEDALKQAQELLRTLAQIRETSATQELTNHLDEFLNAYGVSRD